MTRPPHARQKIIDAAREIVSDQGAGALTFDGLVTASGITRGGITYHFATKRALLQALVADDLSQWQSIESRLRPRGKDDDLAELIAYLRSHTNQQPDRKRLVTGMLSAVMHDPSVLDPVRDYERERFANTDWDDAELMQQLLRFSAVGLFWSELFGCMELPKNVRARLVKKLEALAQDWV